MLNDDEENIYDAVIENRKRQEDLLGRALIGVKFPYYVSDAEYIYKILSRNTYIEVRNLEYRKSINFAQDNAHGMTKLFKCTPDIASNFDTAIKSVIDFTLTTQ